MAEECGRSEVGQSEVAKVLARMPPSEEDVWPCLAARRLLETHQYTHLRTGLHIAKRNLRGATTRSPRSGGAQERELRDGYLRDAQDVATAWPQTAALLRDLAEDYEGDAHYHDRKAERFRDP